MSNEEEIKKLEEQIFYLQMKDRWSHEDTKIFRQWTYELEQLKKGNE